MMKKTFVSIFSNQIIKIKMLMDAVVVLDENSDSYWLF